MQFCIQLEQASEAIRSTWKRFSRICQIYPVALETIKKNLPSDRPVEESTDRAVELTRYRAID